MHNISPIMTNFEFPSLTTKEWLFVAISPVLLQPWWSYRRFSQLDTRVLTARCMGILPTWNGHFLSSITVLSVLILRRRMRKQELLTFPIFFLISQFFSLLRFKIFFYLIAIVFWFHAICHFKKILFHLIGKNALAGLQANHTCFNYKYLPAIKSASAISKS